MATVLLVDSSLVQGKLLADVLKLSGHKVRVTHTGADALAAARTNHPDVLVTDIQLPDMDGLELVRAARAEFPSVPVMITTQRGSEELAVEALKAGAANYLPKRNLARCLAPMLDDMLGVASSLKQKAAFEGHVAAVEYQVVLSNKPALVADLVSLVEEMTIKMGAFDGGERMLMGMAVHEAATNAIVHGNLEVSSDLKEDNWDRYHQAIADRSKTPPYSDRRVKVTLRAERRGEMFVCIADDGPGYDVSSLPDPTDPANMEKGCGRGMMLIRTIFDEVSHNPKGNEIRMTKRAKAPEPILASA
jgi:CheY-like chemotaxis protein/anti-sigma regulatory factor (Ser/Thr protein kinase)